ncbi:DUF1694 domain-containing protein [Bacillus methanolicus]|nr:DUF1694 domain-containing protein [Bacillus methanolicus]
MVKEELVLPKQNVNDYILQGIHGKKETKPDERRKFLGILRERIVAALTQHQVRENGVYKEMETLMKENPNAHLYLNGNMNYSYLSKYMKVAKKYKIESTIVTNKVHDTEIGLVLAYDFAIDKEEIYIMKQKEENPQPQKGKSQKGLLSVFKNVFKKEK